MTFREWQELSPDAAAREVLARIQALPEAQRRAGFCETPSLETLTLSIANAAAGPLKGVPFMVKDLFDVAGRPTRAGSSFLPEVRPTPTSDSDLVREIAARGGAFAGKTHLFEFAWGLTGENAHYGDCEHPRFPGRTTGGSSSGSALAVACGAVPLALGTDTGGSIRVPAAFCGLFGFRGVPKHRWITDAVPLAPSFDTAGWFTTNALDMHIALSALVGIRPSEPRMRGVILEPNGLEPEVATAFRKAAGQIGNPTDEATRKELTAAFAGLNQVYPVVAGRESWKVHAAWKERYADRYGPVLRQRLAASAAITDAQLAATEGKLRELRATWAKFFLTYDFLVLPAAPFAALARDQLTQQSRERLLELTAPASLGGLPVLTIPFALESGLTGAMQVIVNSPQSPALEWALERV